MMRDLAKCGLPLAAMYVSRCDETIDEGDGVAVRTAGSWCTGEDEPKAVDAQWRNGRGDMRLPSRSRVCGGTIKPRVSFQLAESAKRQHRTSLTLTTVAGGAAHRASGDSTDDNGQDFGMNRAHVARHRSGGSLLAGTVAGGDGIASARKRRASSSPSRPTVPLPPPTRKRRATSGALPPTTVTADTDRTRASPRTMGRTTNPATGRVFRMHLDLCFVGDAARLKVDNLSHLCRLMQNDLGRFWGRVPLSERRRAPARAEGADRSRKHAAYQGRLGEVPPLLDLPDRFGEAPEILAKERATDEQLCRYLAADLYVLRRTEKRLDMRIVFPHMPATADMALMMRESLLCELTRLSARPAGDNLCSYSHYSGRCTTCGGEDDADATEPDACGTCLYEGHISTLKPIASLTADGKCHQDTAMGPACIRLTPDMLVATGWRPYTGAPRPRPDRDTRKGRRKDAVAPPRGLPIKVPRECLRFYELVRFVRRMHPCYGHVEGLELQCNHKCATYRLLVEGRGANYCLNIKGDHESDRVYFEATTEGITQHCCSCPPGTATMLGLPSYSLVRFLFASVDISPPMAKARRKRITDAARKAGGPDDEVFLFFLRRLNPDPRHALCTMSPNMRQLLEQGREDAMRVEAEIRAIDDDDNDNGDDDYDNDNNSSKGSGEMPEAQRKPNGSPREDVQPKARSEVTQASRLAN